MIELGAVLGSPVLGSPVLNDVALLTCLIRASSSRAARGAIPEVTVGCRDRCHSPPSPPSTPESPVGELVSPPVPTSKPARVPVRVGDVVLAVPADGEVVPGSVPLRAPSKPGSDEVDPAAAGRAPIALTIPTSPLLVDDAHCGPLVALETWASGTAVGKGETWLTGTAVGKGDTWLTGTAVGKGDTWLTGTAVGKGETRLTGTAVGKGETRLTGTIGARAT